MREIKLSRNQVALVDDEDFDTLSTYTWNAWRHSNPPHSYYAVSWAHGRMHRIVLGITDSKIHIDHINGDSLDNRKSNLRVVTHSQNTKNAKLNARSTSGYKGVSWYKSTKKWRSQIQCDGIKYNLGYHSTKEEAAKAYNIAAIHHFGEFARLNVIKT